MVMVMVAALVGTAAAAWCVVVARIARGRVLRCPAGILLVDRFRPNAYVGGAFVGVLSRLSDDTLGLVEHGGRELRVVWPNGVSFDPTAPAALRLNDQLAVVDRPVLCNRLLVADNDRESARLQRLAELAPGVDTVIVGSFAILAP